MGIAITSLSPWFGIRDGRQIFGYVTIRSVVITMRQDMWEEACFKRECCSECLGVTEALSSTSQQSEVPQYPHSIPYLQSTYVTGGICPQPLKNVNILLRGLKTTDIKWVCMVIRGWLKK